MKTNETMATNDLLVADIMTIDPIVVGMNSSVEDATHLLRFNSITGLPVVDEEGVLVGVISQTDLLIREHNARRKGTPDYYAQADLAAGPFEFDDEDAGDAPKVTDLMTPVVFGVRPDATSRTVIAEMLRLRVHRMFVIDADGVLVGVVSMTDVLRHLIE